MSDIVPPAGSEDRSHMRIFLGCVRLLLVPLLTQISTGRFKQSALAAQCGIKVAIQSGFPWELINEMESHR